MQTNSSSVLKKFNNVRQSRSAIEKANVAVKYSDAME